MARSSQTSARLVFWLPAVTTAAAGLRVETPPEKVLRAMLGIAALAPEKK